MPTHGRLPYYAIEAGKRLMQAEFFVYRKAGWKPRYARGLTATTSIGTVISQSDFTNRDAKVPQNGSTSN